MSLLLIGAGRGAAGSGEPPPPGVAVLAITASTATKINANGQESTDVTSFTLSIAGPSGFTGLDQDWPFTGTDASEILEEYDFSALSNDWAVYLFTNSVNGGSSVTRRCWFGYLGTDVITTGPNIASMARDTSNPESKFDFSYTPYDGMSTCDIHLYTSNPDGTETNGTLVASSSDTGGVAIESNPIDPPAQYWARIKQFDFHSNYIWGPSSNEWLVPVQAAAPTVTGTTPSGSGLATGTISFTAVKPSGAATNADVYTKLYTAAAPTTSIAEIAGISGTFTALAYGDYILRSHGNNPGGDGSSSSDTTTSVAETAPEAPAGVSPAGYTGDDPYTVDVQWSATTGATSYNAYINGSLYESNVSSPKSFSGVIVGDALGITALNSGGESSISSFIFAL